MSSKTAFMTMDVESFYDTEFLLHREIQRIPEYSQEDSIKDYIQLLEKYNIKGTFFTVATSLTIAGPYLKQAASNGHEIALHGLDHQSPCDMTLNQFKEKTICGKKQIEDQLQVKINGYRAPCFGINDERLKILKEEGFSYDSSHLDFSTVIKSGKIDLSEYHELSDSIYKKDSFFEFALSKTTFFGKTIPVSGGAYLRLIPWTVVKYLVKKYIKNHNNYIFYVHPFEISRKKNPVIKPLSFGEKIFLNKARKQYLKKIEWIIKYLIKNGFEFQTMKDYQNMQTKNYSQN